MVKSILTVTTLVLGFATLVQSRPSVSYGESQASLAPRVAADVEDLPRFVQPAPPPGSVEPAITPCSFSGSAAGPRPTLCLGAPQNLSFTETGDRADLAYWIKNTLRNHWKPEWKDIERRPLNPGAKKQKLNLSVLGDAHTVELKSLRNRQLIVGRIKSTTPHDPEDERYGITDPKNELEKYFYIVVDGWKPTGVAGPYDMVIANWKIYGIKTGRNGAKDSVVPVGSRTGTFRYCKMIHKGGDKKYGARFMTCETADTLYRTQRNPVIAAALGSRLSLLEAIEEITRGNRDSASVAVASAQLLRRAPVALLTPSARAALITSLAAVIMSVYVDDEFSPAWMMCGAGCCTADT